MPPICSYVVTEFVHADADRGADLNVFTVVLVVSTIFPKMGNHVTTASLFRVRDLSFL